MQKSRKKFHRVKHLYKLNRSEANRINLQNECKTYKKTLHNYHFEFKNKNISKLKSLGKSNPRKYW